MSERSRDYRTDRVLSDSALTLGQPGHSGWESHFAWVSEIASRFACKSIVMLGARCNAEQHGGIAGYSFFLHI